MLGHSPALRSIARVCWRRACWILCFSATFGSLGVACTTRSHSRHAPVGASDTGSSFSTPNSPSPAASVGVVLRYERGVADAGAVDAGTTASSAGRNCPELPTKAGGAGTPCGDLRCLAFESPAAAFAHVLTKQPRVLGIGESHAQKGSESVTPTPRRFAEQILPSLCGLTSSMILEIWLPRNDCGDERVKQVEKQQRPATVTQSKSNQNDYLALGYAAKRFGIEPSALVPTCDEYQAILDAGPDSIARMLALIGSKTAERVLEELRRAPDPGAVATVIAYGGAMHNDAEPAPDRQEFSYGPRLLRETNGGYIELDLVIREYVRDTEAWKKQPYYRALRKTPLPDKTLLYQWGEHSFALVFAAK